MLKMGGKQAKELAEELAKTIIARILLIVKSEQFFGNIYTVLLVEGGTDEFFVNKLEIQNFKCIAISDVRTAEEELMKSYYNYCKEKQSDNKRVARRDVLNTVNVLNDKHKNIAGFYGLIDKDFTTDKSDKIILVTPTHDLETLLLSTDEEIFDENIKEAFEISRHVAYLIGKVEKYLQDHGYIYRKLQDNDYRDIIPIQKRQLRLDDVMYLKDLTDFARLLDVLIDENNDDKLRIIREVSQNISNIEIDGYSDNDIYNIANGHDIANIMKLLCKEDIDKFIKSHNAEVHKKRDVEYAIIAKYNLSNFKNSPLYKDMTKIRLTPTTITE